MLNLYMKIKDTLDNALNVIWYEICEKNRINSNIINIDKYNDIDGYVSKLTDVINNEIQLINKIGETINHIRHEINNKTNMVNEIIHKASVMDNDTLHLIDDKLDKIIRQTRKKIKIMLENTITPEAKIITAKTKDTTDNTKDSTDNAKDSTDNIKNTIDNIKDIITLPKTTIEKYKSELDETIKNIELIFESFACEKFMNENFNVRSYNEKDYEISMWSINKLEKDAITLNNIKLCDDMILLETQKEMENMMEDRKLFIDEELISLQLTQIKDDNGIKRQLNIITPVK